MSPRLASTTTGTSGGIAARIRSRRGQPGRPERLEEREVRLDRCRVGAAASTSSRANRSMPARSRLNPRAGRPGPDRGPGTGPCRPRRAVAASRSRYARRSRGARRTAMRTPGRSVGGACAGSRSAGMNQSGRDAPSSPDTLGQGLRLLRPSSSARVRPGSPCAGRRSGRRCGRTRWRRRPATRSARTMRHPWSGAASSAPAIGVEDDHVGPERVGPRGRDVPAVRRARRFEVAGAGHRRRRPLGESQL